MNDIFQGLMREATRLTQSGRLSEATQTIQRAMQQAASSKAAGVDAAQVKPPYSPPATDGSRGGGDGEGDGEVLEGCVFELDEATAQPKTANPTANPTVNPTLNPFQAATGFASRAPISRDSFASGQFVRDAQAHHYKLYTPAQPTTDVLLPLVVMLHGCTQNPDDFAVGTGMNVAARGDENTPGFYVLYPSQTRASNAQGCWNWFERSHQRRGQGEPAWIAELTQQLVRTLPIDGRRIYVAGLSAGGAMAAIVAAAYPDIFAAVGIHSGLPVGAARNLSEALTAMKHGASPTNNTNSTDSNTNTNSTVPSIVFHGDQDRTVNARNGHGLIHAASAGQSWEQSTEVGVAPGGRRHTRSVHARDGKTHVELWQLHGAGHAWSGGHPAGSYTDAKGIDATREMLRFFFQHQLAD